MPNQNKKIETIHCMTLKPSKLRRLNQRLTLAKYKTKDRIGQIITSIIGASITKKFISQTIHTTITSKQSRGFFSNTVKLSASEARYLKQLQLYYVACNYLETGLAVVLICRIVMAIFQSYSRKKY